MHRLPYCVRGRPVPAGSIDRRVLRQLPGEVPLSNQLGRKRCHCARRTALPKSLHHPSCMLPLVLPYRASASEGLEEFAHPPRGDACTVKAKGLQDLQFL